MTKLNKALIELLNMSITESDSSYWKVELEDNKVHIFVSRIVTALDVLNTLGNSGITYSLSYVIDSIQEEAVISAADPIEIEVIDIPKNVLAFSNNSKS